MVYPIANAETNSIDPEDVEQGNTHWAIFIEIVPEQLKTQGISERAVEDKSETPKFVPDHLKTQKMCNEAMRENPACFFFFFDTYRFKTKEI